MSQEGETTPQSCTTLICAAHVLPLHTGDLGTEHPAQALSTQTSQTQTIRDGAIAIDGARIVAVGPRAELQQRFDAQSRIDLDHHIVLPGLINTHGHAAMTLLRGLGDGLQLQRWLREVIWPLEATFADQQYVADGVDLALVEMLRSGTTCFSDMYFFPEVCAERTRHAGVRAQIAFPVIDAANAWSDSADAGISAGLELHDQLRNDPLLDVAFGPHSTYTLSRSALERIRMYSDELESRVQIHLHENAAEIDEASSRGKPRPIDLLEEVGLLNPRLQAVHMTQLNAADIDRLRETGSTVSHCPASNMKLASGVCPVSELHAAGVPVGLGTDGAASNDSLNLFQEARLAALLAKLQLATQPEATQLPAQHALSMATLQGARVLGLDAQIGSLHPGKQADIIAVDTESASLQPLHDPASQLLHGAGNFRVSDSWIAGRRVLASGELLTIDEADVLRRAHTWRERIAAGRANV